MKRMIWATFALAWISLVPAAKADLMYNLAADWSDRANPNGVWSYRQGNSLLPEVANFNAAGTLGYTQPGWAPSNNAGNFLPVEFKATQAENDWQVGDVVVHTTDSGNGPNSGPANFLWTASTAGTVTISGGLWAAAILAGRDNDWSLLVNGVTVSSGTGIDAHDRAHPFDLSAGTGGSAALVQDVLAGSTIELLIVKSATSFPGYFAGVNFNLSESQAPVAPEPSTVVAAGTGIACCVIAGLFRRLRKRYRGS